MTAPTNLVASQNVGVREDLSDIIHRVAPEKTPFISSIGKTKATNTYHEWQTETLASPVTTNYALEGDDVGTLGAANLTTRVGNYCQIMTKSGGVSRTQEVVDKAGRASELARQKTLKGIELRRDMEKRFLANVGSNAESGATPRKTAGLLAWITSNVSRGSGAAAGGFSGGTVTAFTPGTSRTWTEALLKSVLATAFGNGATPSQLYMGAAHKQQFSTFTGIADIRKDVGSGQATIVAGAEVYVGDFGELVAIPHQYAMGTDVLAVDPSLVKAAMLDGYKTTPLAKTGDSERFLMTVEAALEVGNEKGHAAICDLS